MRRLCKGIARLFMASCLVSLIFACGWPTTIFNYPMVAALFSALFGAFLYDISKGRG